MKAVILAAGVGSRLGELAKNTPKCLIKIGEKTILERNIDILVNNGIKKEVEMLGKKYKLRVQEIVRHDKD